MMVPRRVKVGEHELHVREWGDPRAPALLTIHGFVISQAYMVPLARILGERYHVLAPDLPGFGRSSKPRDAPGFDEHADVLAAFLAAEGVPRAHVVGNSMGCQVALALAQRHPERVDRLALIGPTTDAHARTVPRQAARLARDLVRERPSLPWVHVPDYVRCGPRRIWQTLRHTMEDAPEARAAHVRAPTLLLRGERDALVSNRFVHELARAMPDARVMLLPGAPHAANYSAAEAAATAIEAFLTPRPRAPRAT
jgi:pimeloyl-ACP methyl ester carboxylesterase